MFDSSFDPDVTDPNIYYEITADRALACVYDATLWGKGVFIIFDVAGGESWSRLRDDEISYDLVVLQKWVDRYNRLVIENPSLPHNYLYRPIEVRGGL